MLVETGFSLESWACYIGANLENWSYIMFDFWRVERTYWLNDFFSACGHDRPIVGPSSQWTTSLKPINDVFISMLK